MTASSPVTMEDLVNGLKLIKQDGNEYGIALVDGDYRLVSGETSANTVSISSDGLTITFGRSDSHSSPFTGFTFNA